MTIKSAMSEYFRRLTSAWNNKGYDFPRIVWDENVERFIYVGEPDEEEWISWKPVEKNKVCSFDEDEQILLL